MNEKYSYKDFSGQSFVLVDPAEFNNTEIIGSGFSQEGAPDTNVFPALMTGATFKRCNLENVAIPPGNTVVTVGDDKCGVNRVMVQNDLENWHVDSGNKPVSPVNLVDFDRFKLSADPTDIPSTPMSLSIVMQKELALVNVREIIDRLNVSLTNTLSLSDEALLKKTYGISDAEIVLIKEQIA